MIIATATAKTGESTFFDAHANRNDCSVTQTKLGDTPADSMSTAFVDYSASSSASASGRPMVQEVIEATLGVGEFHPACYVIMRIIIIL